jgi:hypothetical protein
MASTKTHAEPRHGADALKRAAHAQRCYDFRCQELSANFLRSACFFPLRASEEPEPARCDG